MANYALFLSNVADKHRKIDASQFVVTILVSKGIFCLQSAGIPIGN